MQSPRTSTIKGFTLVELLVVMGIFTVLAGLGLFVSMGFYRSYSYSTQTGLLVSALQRSRSRSMNNINATLHGVHVDATTYTMFQGATYAPADPNNEASVFASGVTSLTSADVIFTQLSGSLTSGPLTMVITDGIHTSTISFNNEGRISW